MVVIGIANAAIRQATYASELAAHQISTLRISLLYGTYAWAVLDHLRLHSPNQAPAVGLTWMVLAILFEFGFSRYVVGDPWAKLLHAHNVVEGRVWGVFIPGVALAPHVFYRIRTRGRKVRPPR